MRKGSGHGLFVEYYETFPGQLPNGHRHCVSHTGKAWTTGRSSLAVLLADTFDDGVHGEPPSIGFVEPRFMSQPQTVESQTGDCKWTGSFRGSR